jgi:hypothetical protein
MSLTSCILCSIVWPRTISRSEARYWPALTSFSFGVALSPLGNILAIPVRFSLNKCSAFSDNYPYPSYAENPYPGLGTQITQAVCPSLLPLNSEDPDILKFGSAIHAVLVSELQLFSMEEDRVSHIQHIVATYIFFTHLQISNRASTDMPSSPWN